jgi:hypothetical protein
MQRVALQDPHPGQAYSCVRFDAMGDAGQKDWIMSPLWSVRVNVLATPDQVRLNDAWVKQYKNVTTLYIPNLPDMQSDLAVFWRCVPAAIGTPGADPRFASATVLLRAEVATSVGQSSAYQAALLSGIGSWFNNAVPLARLSVSTVTADSSNASRCFVSLLIAPADSASIATAITHITIAYDLASTLPIARQMFAPRVVDIVFTFPCADGSSSLACRPSRPTPASTPGPTATAAPSSQKSSAAVFFWPVLSQFLTIVSLFIASSVM